MNGSMRQLQLLPTLRELHLGYDWNLPVCELPPLPAALELLRFGGNFDQSVAELQLPSSLRTLIFGWRLCQPLHKLRLPAGLERLAL